MSDQQNPVDRAFRSLRSDAQQVEVNEPLAAITERRPFIRPAVLLSAAAVIVLVVIGAVALRGDTDSDLVAGTPDGGQDGAVGSDEAGLIGSSWTLTSGTGPEGPVPIVPDWPITLTFDVDTLGGTAACNGYGGEYSIDGDRISLGGLGHTDMGCDGAVMASQSAFLAAVTEVDQVLISGSTLTLTGPGTELVFSLDAPVPVAELVGQLWLLDTLIDGETATTVRGDPATLLLRTGGAINGSTGCRSLSGEYVINGSQVLFTTFSAGGDCPSELSKQDSHVVGVLGDGFTAAIDGQRLTVTSAGGLGYRAITEDELADIESDPVATDAELLAGTSWRLIAGERPDGVIDIIEGSAPNLALDGSSTGFAATVCNTLGGSFTIGGGRIAFEITEETDMQCEEAGLMGSEGAFAAALEEVTEYGIEADGERLVMTGGDGTELLFERFDPGDVGPSEGAVSVTELLDLRPEGTVSVEATAIDTGGGWILCDQPDAELFSGCRGRNVVVTNFDPAVDAVGEGAWEGSLTEDFRYAIAGRDPLTVPTAEQAAVAEAFGALSAVAGTLDTTGLGLADVVLIGLGDQLIEERTAAALRDQAAWTLDTEQFRAWTGPFSALDLLIRAESTEVIVGPHNHCASPPAPISDQIEFSSHLSLQPTGITSCLEWFTVDLFLDAEGRVSAITLDLWEP